MTASEVPVAVDEPPPTGMRPGPLALAMASTTVAALPVFLLGGMAVLVREDLRFSEAILGVVAATFWAAATLTSASAGMFAQRIPARRGLAFTAAGNAIVLLGIGLLTRSWIHLAAFMAVAGILMAFGQPAANLLITQAMPRNRNGVAFGIKQSSVPLATLLAGSAVPVIALTVGWRWAFATAAGLAAVVCVLALRRASTDGRAKPASGRLGPVGPLVLVAVVAAFGAGAGNAMGAFYVDSSVTMGSDVGLAGAFLAFGGASSIALRIGLGWQADRRGGNDLGIIALLMVVGAGGFVAIPLAPTPLLLALATFVAFAGGWSWNGLLLRTVVVDHPTAPAAATGVTQTGVYAGAVFGPLLFGLIAEKASHTVAWWFIAGWLVIGSALATVLRFRSAGIAPPTRQNASA